MAGRVRADVEPGDDIGNLRFAERQLRHAFIGAAFANDGRDEDAFFVIEYENRADEIGRAWPSLAGRAMAAGAIGGEDFAAALEGGRVLAGAGYGCGAHARVCRRGRV